MDFDDFWCSKSLTKIYQEHTILTQIGQQVLQFCMFYVIYIFFRLVVFTIFTINNKVDLIYMYMKHAYCYIMLHTVQTVEG
jgi:hypothetical protein